MGEKLQLEPEWTRSDTVWVIITITLIIGECLTFVLWRLTTGQWPFS